MQLLFNFKSSGGDTPGEEDTNLTNDISMKPLQLNTWIKTIKMFLCYKFSAFANYYLLSIKNILSSTIKKIYLKTHSFNKHFCGCCVLWYCISILGMECDEH